LTVFRNALLFLIVVSVMACGGEAAAPTATPAPILLHFVTFDALGGLERALADAFSAANPGLEVDVQNYRQAPANYLTDPNPPDLMLLVPGEQLATAIDNGLLTDISQLWQEAGLDTSYPASFRTMSERDGKQYLLPIGYTWNALYYNVALFAQYGLQPPQTWDEFITLCDTLLINGETPLALSGDDAMTASLWIDYLALRMDGADFQRQLAHGEISYEDDRVRAIFETWHSLIDRGYFLAEARTLSGLAAAMTVVRNEQLELSRGKAAMILGGPVTLNDLPALFRSELGFFPFPIIDPTLPSAEAAYTAGFVVPAAAPHREEALAFLSFLNSDVARELVGRDVQSSNLYVPALANVDADQLSPVIRQGMTIVTEADAVVSPYSVSVGQPMRVALDSMLRRLLADSSSSKPFDLNELLAALEAARLQE
jgi:ABC-type glycerol-3-phosphate transport system substrate-binding protein